MLVKITTMYDVASWYNEKGENVKTYVPGEGTMYGDGCDIHGIQVGDKLIPWNKAYKQIKSGTMKVNGKQFIDNGQVIPEGIILKIELTK